MNKDGKITKTEVVDKEGNAQIIMNFSDIKYNKKFDKNYFELSSLLQINQKEENKKDNEKTNNNNTNNNDNTATNNSVNQETENNTQKKNTDELPNTNQNNTTSNSETKSTASINDIVYPMYLPNNTYLTSQEKINTKQGERLILTFGGDSSFILVEETSKIEEENLVIPTQGEFDFLTDVIGIIGTHSLSWNSNGIDYYMTSDVIETAELIDIARSISVLPVSK